MKVFEIHITGEYGINDILTEMGIKNIVVELLKPDGDILRTEYMSSFIEKYETFDQCFKRVSELADKLEERINVIRVKIESPYYEEYANRSVYMESHFIPKDNQYPVSRNQRTQKLMGTDREYNKNNYLSFINKWDGNEIELCLYDSFVREDFDWMELYKLKN